MVSYSYHILIHHIRFLYLDKLTWDKVVKRLKPKRVISNHGDLHQQVGWYHIAIMAEVPIDSITLGKNGVEVLL